MIIETKYICLFILVIISSIHSQDIFGEEPILISISSSLDKVVFDGKWTDSNEWKQSSYNRFYFEDGNEIHLRTAHQGNFIYVQINFASDMIVEKNSDSAVICFDTKNDKTSIPQSDDYCFSTSIDNNQSFTYQGNGITAINGYFKKIPNHKDFLAVGSPSDKHDRYNKTPHASYEFKIPLELLGRSNNYGFYVSVFDGHSQNHYSWPYKIEKQSLLSIESPKNWGDLVSPDKSLPEFNFSLFLVFLIPLIIFSIIPRFYFSKIIL